MDKFRRVVGILLIIIGVVIIGDVAYKKIITLKKQKEIVELFENGFSEGTSTEGATESSESVNLDEINGYKPIAIIEIPSINLKLPVISTFDYDRLKIAPCIYYGSIETNDLVICGHSYKNHFRYLKELKSGDIITITDMNSNTYYYEVALVEILKPTEVLEMIESSFDLTLYTCTSDSRNRITVRCNRIK